MSEIFVCVQEVEQSSKMSQRGKELCLKGEKLGWDFVAFDWN
jgi:hypothetical protein